jgi:hypothetical protein
MESVRIYRTDEELHLEALKYKTRGDFWKYSGVAAQIACNREIYEKICSHMPPSETEAYSFEELQKIALKYKTIDEFIEKDNSAFAVACKRHILEAICSHIDRSGGSSGPERELMTIIKESYPSAKKLKDTKVKIKDRPYAHGFEIDIYIPELNLGIEFDGTWYHSFEGLKRSRPEWPDEAISNYHQIKDDWFLSSKGIKILHINGLEWKTKKEQSLLKILQFLGN